MKLNLIKDAVIESVQDNTKREWCHFKLESTQEEMKSFLTDLCTRFEPAFQWHDDYNAIADWLIDNKSKGLFLMGGCGNGKTLFTTKVLPAIYQAAFNKRLAVYDARIINSKADEVRSKLFLCIDDIGAEPRHKEYGNEIEVFSEVVDNAEKEGGFVIVTTNLSGQELKDRYGERCLDRVKAVCKVIVLNNIKSQRKQ